MRGKWTLISVVGIIVISIIAGNAVAANLTTTATSAGKGANVNSGYTVSGVDYVTGAGPPVVVTTSNFTLKRTSDGTGASTVTTANSLVYSQLQMTNRNTKWSLCSIASGGAVSCPVVSPATSAGGLDTDFNLESDGVVGANGTVLSSAQQNDGKIVIGGLFTSVRGVVQNQIARLNPDGSLDTSFNTGSDVGTNGAIWSINVQTDGKIIIGGDFTQVRGVTQNRIARLNTDGTLDTGFNTGGTIGVDSTVLDTKIQSDGKILIGGSFTSARGTTQNGIARLNTNGTLDTGFNTGANVGTSGSVWVIEIQSDGKIIIGGNYSLARGATQNNIARLSTTGTLDTTFNTGGTIGVNSAVYAAKIQTDGKIVVGGNFTTARGTTRNRIARLNTDGALDTGFNTGGTVGVSASVYSMALQSDGKIIVGGFFVNARGEEQNYITRLNTDGARDSGFNTGAPVGTDAAVWNVNILTGSQIFIGGAFSTARGVTQNNFALLYSETVAAGAPLENFVNINVVAYDKLGS
jgi:uncharacterized delta-60 repeat protein